MNKVLFYYHYYYFLVNNLRSLIDLENSTFNIASEQIGTKIPKLFQHYLANRAKKGARFGC